MPEKPGKNREQLKEITDRIEAGIRDIFESGDMEKYRNYLRTMSRFHNYSLNNQALIHLQRPDATFVAGYNRWRDKFSRHVLRGGQNFPSESRRRRTVPESAVKAVPSRPVSAGGDHQQHRSLRGSRFSGGETLDALINILVQGITTVAGNDDISLLFRLHLAVLKQQAATRLMGLHRISSKGGGHLFLLVDEDVDNISELCQTAGFQHILMQRIALQNPCPGLRRGDEPGTVIPKHRDLVAHAGEDTFPPAGKTRKKVGFDEALRYQKVGLRRSAVDDTPGSRGQYADIHISGRIPAVVDDDFFPLIDFVPQLLPQFLCAGRPVKAGSH